jgi:hypothetical protein
VRQFSPSFIQGVGFYLRVPTNSTVMSIEMIIRPENAPSPGARVISQDLWWRAINPATGPQPSGWNMWNLNDMTMASGMTSFQYKARQTIPLSTTPGMSPGISQEFELVSGSPTGGSALGSPWDLFELLIDFQ